MSKKTIYHKRESSGIFFKNQTLGIYARRHNNMISCWGIQCVNSICPEPVIIDSDHKPARDKKRAKVFRDAMNDWNYITVDIYTHLYREQTDIK